MSYFTAYILSDIIASVMSIILGFCFLFISVPNLPILFNYKKTRKMLASAYFILGFGNLFATVFTLLQLTLNETILFSSVLTIASFQAFLFTYTLTTLLNPDFLKIPPFIRQLSYILGFLSLIIVASILGNIEIVRIINYVFYLFYLGQLFFYTRCFFKEKKKFTIRLRDFYSGNEEKRLNWVKTAFLSSLTIGILVAINLHLGAFNLIWLIVVYTFFYVYFAIKYLSYPQIFSSLSESFMTSSEHTVSISYPDLSNNLEKWVDSKGFLNSDLTISKLASELNTNRTYLSTCINSTMQMNFNTWINTLRVNEALLLMERNPEWSISRISEETGFTDLTCFGKHFKKITGETPRMVRAKYQRSNVTDSV
ncbi:helix-turn-helix domain-containing protein [Bacteroidales bacterium OttesenSCG-928-A17]|nr:helix-turn-helix domain-containing protein [Bacteroidales bacterium OttesenSCG-928-A17]